MDGFGNQLFGLSFSRRTCDPEVNTTRPPRGNLKNSADRPPEQARGDKDEAVIPRMDMEISEDLSTAVSMQQITDKQVSLIAKALLAELQPQLEESLLQASMRMEQRLQSILEGFQAQLEPLTSARGTETGKSRLSNSLKWAQQGCVPVQPADPGTPRNQRARSIANKGVQQATVAVTAEVPHVVRPAGGNKQAGGADATMVRSMMDVVVVPQLEKVVQAVARLEKLQERGSGTGVEVEQQMEKLRGLEERLLQKVEETRSAVLSTVQPAVHALRTGAVKVPGLPRNSGVHPLPRTGTNLSQKSPRELQRTMTNLTLSGTRVEGSVVENTPDVRSLDPPPPGRTLVINFRRLQALLELSNIYHILLQASAVVGFVGVLLVSEDPSLLFLDLGFVTGGCLLFVMHCLEHSTPGLAKHSALGELVGDDGQVILEETSPGQRNPNRCIAALSLRLRNAWILASVLKVFLWFMNVAFWIIIFLVWIEVFGFWDAHELMHVAALNAIGSLHLVTNVLFGMLLRREMCFVLPLKADGTPHSLAEESVPHLFSWLLGPPSIWFGCPEALDDLRIWASLASHRTRKWTLHHETPTIFPEQIAAYALQGREKAMRVARDLRGAKLFDRHRRKFGKRYSNQPERKPAVIMTGLSSGNKRGHVYDVDLRRENAEQLDLHLIMYDSRCEHSWEPVQFGRDPLDWVDFVQWQGSEPFLAAKKQEDDDDTPVWNPTNFMASGPDLDIFPGTFGGFRAAVCVTRHWLGAGSFATDVQMEIAALKKLSDHPNIMGILTSGVTPEGKQYLAMETCEAIGCLLNQLSNQYQWAGHPLPPQLATKLFMGLSEAVAFMHTRGIVHRSLRAEGVVVTMDHQAKLADMGMVARVGMRQRLKASHLSPEVCRGMPLEAATDLWGLGVILHEIYQGSSDLVDWEIEPPRPLPGTPSVARPMELFLQEAMQGLLNFDAGYRWTMDMLKASQWFDKVKPGGGVMPVLTMEYEHRQHLRRYLGRAPPPRAYAAKVDPYDKGLLGKTLGDVGPTIQAHLQLVRKNNGIFSFPRGAVKLEVGDWLFLGLPQSSEADTVVGRINRELVMAAEAQPPVPGFQRTVSGIQNALSKALAATAAEDTSDVMSKLVPFQPEFDCFSFPPHACDEEGVFSLLRENCVHVIGILREGQWQPEWFPPLSAVAQPGDMGLVLRAPQKEQRATQFSGLTVPCVDDNDLELLMQPKEFAARLAIRRGLVEGGTAG